MTNILTRIAICHGLFLCLSGCGGSGIEEPPLGAVKGTVKINGSPGANLEVVFQPKGKGGPSIGTTDAQGKYELLYKGAAKGAVIGTHMVRIDHIIPGGVGEAGGEKAVPLPKPLPAIYNRETTLTKDVKAGAQTIDFELTEKK